MPSEILFLCFSFLVLSLQAVLLVCFLRFKRRAAAPRLNCGECPFRALVVTRRKPTRRKGGRRRDTGGGLFCEEDALPPEEDYSITPED